MRSLEEIHDDIRNAFKVDDSEALRPLAAEMQTLGTPKAEAIALSTLGYVFRRTSDYPSALEHYRRAIAIHEELGDHVAVASVTGSMGIVYANTGDYPSALEHYRRSLIVHEESGDRDSIARITGNMGGVYQSMGDYPAALEHCRRALDIHHELGNRTSAANVTATLGSVYRDTGNYPAAMEYYRRALSLYEELDHRPGVAMITGNMGIVYRRTGDYQAALGCYRGALTIHEELGDRASIAIVNASIATVYHYMGDFELGLEYGRRALALDEELGRRASVAYDIGIVIAALIGRAEYAEAKRLLDQQSDMRMDDPGVRALHLEHRARVAEQEGDLNAANEHLQRALQITTEAGLRDQSADHHQMLRDLAQKRNDFAGYIEHNNEYQRITEEIHGREATQKLVMMEAERKMEAERQERERERAVLYSTLPKDVADRVIRGEDVSGDEFDHASVLFLDVAGFTTYSHNLNPREVTVLLDAVFEHFDEICERHHVTKIKTIGDAYLCFAHEGNGESGMGNDAAQRIAAAALTMQQAEFYWPTAPANSNGNRVQFRIGLHSGPVVAGVIGKQRLQYDVWGDTVNVASRMESTGEPGRIQVSESFARALCLVPSTSDESNQAPGTRHPALTERGAIDVKGKGSMTTYWLEGA